PQLSTQLATPGFRPNIIGSVYLLSQGVNLLTASAPQRAAYDAIAGALNAARPVDGSGQQADDWGTDTQSWSLFTHNIYDLSDKVSLTVGARFNHEEKDMSATLLAAAPFCDALRSSTILPLVIGAQASTPLASSLAALACNPAVNNLQNGAYADSTEENEWSGVASLAFNPSDDMMLFATYSRGYKAGGFNLDRSGFQVLPTTTVKRTTDDLQFKPEFVDNYELGLKWRPFDRATLNATAFYESIEDYQANAFTGFNFVTFNVPKAVSRGIELEMGYRPVEGLTLRSGAVFNEAFFDSAVTAGSETLPAGTRMAHAPRYAVTGSATYEHAVSSKLTGLVYVDGRWNSAYKTQILGRNPVTDNDSYAIFNARAGIRHELGWSIEAFVSNLTDKFYHLHGFAPPEQPGTFSVYPSAPRTFGVTLRAEF
ncbi:MAG: TonB-dependent receptor, partial [Hyphomonadaceae bacterium]